MQPAVNTRLEKSLGYLSWHFAAAAVLRVFRENQKRERADPEAVKASADVWGLNDLLRHEFRDRTRSHWCDLTGLDHTYFPLSTDAVARLFFRFRKRNESELVAFEREIQSAGVALPQPGLYD